MLKELKFVQGAVAKKDLIPALKHFCIENGEIRSFNGSLALSSPIQSDIDCKPMATPFVRAIQQCNETISMHLTQKGRLSIKSGPFKAIIDCIDEVTPHVKPEGEIHEINGESLIEGFKTVLPFVGDDASRPWCNGILINGYTMAATNNVSIVEYWFGDGTKRSEFPIKCNIPGKTVEEIIRIREIPTHVQIDNHSVTFHYEDGKWIRSGFLDLANWPKTEFIFNSEATPQPINAEIYTAVEAIKPFTDRLNCVYLKAKSISTAPLEYDECTSYEVETGAVESVYNADVLLQLKGVANTIDLTTYPKACLFYGEKLRGAIIGMVNNA